MPHVSAQPSGRSRLTWDIAHPIGTTRRLEAPVVVGDLEDLDTDRRLAVETWNGLDAHQRHAIAASVLARLGHLSESTESAERAARVDAPDPQYSDLDEVLTHLGTLTARHHALTQAGHVPDSDRVTESSVDKAPSTFRRHGVVEALSVLTCPVGHA